MSSKETSTSRYKDSGVDIDKANTLIDNIKPIVASTFQRGVLSDIGGFGGLFAIGGDRYKDPVLVSSTDGVGTKLLIANLCDRHDTIGIDLVAMCVNDIIVAGAQPLFFLDYFSTGALDTARATDVIKGIAEGCKIAKCSLIGGETAEMPGLYGKGEYDLAGFSVGIAERDKIIDGSDIKVGDQIIGLASNGLHSNGYSLVRKIVLEEMKLSVEDEVAEFGCTVGEELLRPTRIYSDSIVKLLRHYEIGGLVHITGGGFSENIPRVLPQGCKAVIHAKSWTVPPIFPFLQENGNVSPDEMCRTFNCGIGMVVIVSAKLVDDIVQQLKALGETPFVIGEIAHRPDRSAASVEIDCASSL